MADAPAEPPSASADAADEARNAAAGTRSTARWIASAFAGIPALSIVTALVRAPGDAGFDWLPLAVGVALAALGAVLGIYAFAKVLAPAALTDDDLTGLAVKRLPEAHVDSFAELREALETTRRAVATRRYQASDASGYAAAATARADATDAVVKNLEASAAAAPNDVTLLHDLMAARRSARGRRIDAGEKSADKELKTRELELARENLTQLEALRRAAYGLAAGDIIKKRFDDAKLNGFIAVLLVAAGVVLLALAPKAKTEAAPTPALVTLTLTPAGQKALNCKAPSVQALRVGGSDDAPRVITLPSSACPTPVTTTFKADEPKWGASTPATPIK